MSAYYLKHLIELVNLSSENYALCGMAPNGKKGQGYDILGEGGKNDYDW